MKKNNQFNLTILILLISTITSVLRAEIVILSSCDHKEDSFLKNEYILNLNELTMTRNYVYNEKTFQKYLLVKKLKNLKKKVNFSSCF